MVRYNKAERKEANDQTANMMQETLSYTIDNSINPH